MSDIQEQNIDQLLENVGSKKLEWEAFFEIKVTKKNGCSLCYSIATFNISCSIYLRLISIQKRNLLW